MQRDQNADTWRNVYLRAAIAIRTHLKFAHPDTTNANGDTFVDILRQARRWLRVRPHVLVPKAGAVSSLQCLFARKVRPSKQLYVNRLPALAHFVDLH